MEHSFRHGVRNSLLLAPMPTASTAQILGNNESFEPYTSNIYTRRVLSGEFQVSSDLLVYDYTIDIILSVHWHVPTYVRTIHTGMYIYILYVLYLCRLSTII